MKPLQRSAQAGISAQGTEERTVQRVAARVQQTGITLTIDECQDSPRAIQRELRKQLTIAVLCCEALKSYAIETSSFYSGVPRG